MLDSINIIGLDPGNNLGVSVIEVDSSDLTIKNILTRRYILDKHVGNEPLLKWNLIENIISSLLSDFNPYIVAMESAFLNVRYPKAIITLGAYTTILELTISKYLNSNRIFKYPPKYIKKILGTGNADKVDMMKNVSSIKELNNKIDVTIISEHEIDATAIAYTALLEVRKYPYVLYSL